MAQKKTAPASHKSSSKPVKPGAKAAPPGRASSVKNAGSGKTHRLTPSKTTGGSASSSRKPKKKILRLPFGRNKVSQHSQPQPAPRPVRQGLSLDRKLDILGIAMALVGLLTLLSMLSPINGSLTGGWVAALGMTLGWGMYLFPIGLMATGLWLVLRNFERVPQLSFERLLGLALLSLNLLAIFHFVEMLYTGQKALELAGSSTGGGYIGAATGGALVTAFGYGGAAIGLACWLIIALALTLDITIGEMLGSLWASLTRFQDWIIETIQERQSEHSPAYPSLADHPEYKPPAPISTPGSHAGQPGTQSFAPLPVTAGQSSPTPAWKLPSIDQILDEGGEVNYSDELDLQRARLIEETLASFGAPARVVEINRGPTITQFGVEPDFIEMRGGRMRVRVGKIAALADDLALALSARTIRVQAPVPGKGFVGIEVPNDEVALVALRDLIESEAFKRLKSPLRIALGLNVSGNAVAADLSVMPHLLIAGATGSGKSVCVNSLICCLLANNTPDDLRLVMIDPKRVELTGYNGVPHLLAPVVVDLERVVTVLQWVTREMDMRYRKLAEAGCRNILEYNNRLTLGEKKLPFLVVIVDELADLMMLSPDETERTVTRLAQLARATGIHLVIATQRPSVDVVTGLIKANFPARIAFAVASGMDSRVILDQPGAERLLGRGDMLFQAPDSPAPVRLQGVFVSESEILRLVSYWQSFAGYVQPAPMAAGGTVDALPAGLPLKQIPLWEDMEEEEGDPMMKEAIDLSRRQGRASISMLQRRLRIGYTRAARLIDTMEEKGIVGPPDPGTGTREILDYGPAAPPADEN